MAAASSISGEPQIEGIRQLFFARGFQKQTGKTIYAIAEAKPYNGGIDLVFKTATGPFEEIVRQGQHEELPIERNASPNDFSGRGGRLVLNTAEDDNSKLIAENREVKRVLINLHLADFPPLGLSLESTVVKMVALVVKINFPNLEPRQSILLIHTPFRTYIAKDVLSPGFDASSSIGLEIR